MILGGARYRRGDQVHARRFDAETVILDMTRGEYYSLDEVGGYIWESLMQGLSVAEIGVKLAESYDADQHEILRDAERIVGELVAAGLLVPYSNT